MVKCKNEKKFFKKVRLRMTIDMYENNLEQIIIRISRKKKFNRRSFVRQYPLTCIHAHQKGNLKKYYRHQNMPC
jgi:hypothetical protein